jgi:ArsR family transcriptional regulator
MRVELDKKSLFALASDTRLEILKALQPMRRTVSQLSEALDIDKAAVYRHLKKMEEGGLVVRQEDHGFVYYGLSWKARDLMSPNENTKIIILISSVFVFSILAAFFLMVGLVAVDVMDQPILIPKSPSEDGHLSQVREFSSIGASQAWIILIGFVAAAVIASTLAVRKMRRPRQRIDPSVESNNVERPVPED